MNALLEVLANNRDLVTFGSLLLNGLFVGFVYFHTQRHKRAIEAMRFSHAEHIEELRKEHLLDVEKRKRLYEGKARQYQEYAAKMDKFQKRVGVDVIDEFNPIVQLLIDRIRSRRRWPRLSAEEKKEQTDGEFLARYRDVQLLRFDTQQNTTEQIADKVLGVLTTRAEPS